jgi:hypothetical protein
MSGRERNRRTASSLAFKLCTREWVCGVQRALSRAEVISEANRLYGMSSSDGPHLHAFLNPLILILARSLVQKANAVSDKWCHDSNPSPDVPLIGVRPRPSPPLRHEMPVPPAQSRTPRDRPSSGHSRWPAPRRLPTNGRRSWGGHMSLGTLSGPWPISSGGYTRR